jgi:hypothetical protein
MLPHKQWYNYYNRPCDVCEDEEINPRDDDIAECGGCGHLMCEDCAKFFTECDVCLAKFDEDEDVELDSPSFMCTDCMESCGKCEVSLHPSCMAENMKTCNLNGRAMRAVASAEKAVEEKEEAIQHTKRKLRILEQELEDTKVVKEEAKKKLRRLDVAT